VFACVYIHVYIFTTHSTLNTFSTQCTRNARVCVCVHTCIHIHNTFNAKTLCTQHARGRNRTDSVRTCIYVHKTFMSKTSIHVKDKYTCQRQVYMYTRHSTQRHAALNTELTHERHIDCAYVHTCTFVTSVGMLL